MANRHTSARRYRAVTIVAAPDACRWAKRIDGQRFLVEQAPAIPLRECDASECKCRYKEFQDRRQDERRGADSGERQSAYEGAERRKRRDRRRARASDAENDFFEDV